MIDKWVDDLVAARATSKRFQPRTKQPATVDEAYSIQSGVAQRIGTVGAFKTARKGDASPIMAPIFAGDIVQSGEQVAVKDTLGIELEVGLQIIQDWPLDVTRLPLADMIPLLRPVAVIELVDTRINGPLADDAIVKLSDNQINAGLVIGAEASDWNGSDFGNVEAGMQAGEDLILEGQATVPGGSALKAFASLACQIGSHCGGLKRGQIVITGSLHPLVYYPKGTLVQGWIAGIGTVSVMLGS